MSDFLVLIGYNNPRGCVNAECPMFGMCGMEDQMVLAVHLNVLGNPNVRDELRREGYPLHLVLSEYPRPAEQVLARAA